MHHPANIRHGCLNSFSGTIAPDFKNSVDFAHILSNEIDLAANFGVRPPTPPKLYPWGLREVHVIDPAGVLWHFIQNRGTAAAG